MKKYDSYKDSGVEWIGEVPTHWGVDILNRIFKINTGFTPSTSNNEFYENGVHDWITIRDLDGKYVSESKTKLTDIAVQGKTIIPKGSLLYSFKLSVGQMAFTTKDIYTNEAIFSVFPSEKLNLNYYYYLLDRILIHNSNENIYGAKILNQELIKASKLLVPSEEEQTTIANYLDHKTTQIEHLIAKKEQFIQLLEEERIAVINQAVTKGLDPSVPLKHSGIEWLGEIPKHWEVKKLKQIFNSSKGLTITKENLESEGIPCVNYGEIHSKFGFEVDIEKHQLKCVNATYLDSDYKSLIQTGDFVFADTSEDIVGAGNFTYLKSNHEIFAGYHTIILRALENIESRYFAYQFDSIPFRTQIRQSVKGIKVFSITQGILKNTCLWIPELDEQRQIIEFLDIETERIVSLKNSTRKEIELLKEYKTALISEVVTGKVDVRNEKMN